MKAKTKFIMSIMSVCLVCAVFAIGVFALRTANLKIGGDVSFTATGVEADITNAKLTNGETITNLNNVSITTAKTQSEIDSQMTDWLSLSLEFDESATDILLSFDIKNKATNANHYIEMDYEYSFSEANPNISIVPGENNNYILQPNQTDASPFSLFIKVSNKELDVPETTLSLTISLSHLEPVEATGWSYTANSPSQGEATIKTYTPEEDWDGILEIPAVITDGTNNYIVTTLNYPESIPDPGMYSIAPSSTNQIIFHNSITSTIGCIANYSNQNLTTTVELPISLKSLGMEAFRLSLLTSLTIPAGVNDFNSTALVDNYDFEDTSSDWLVSLIKGGNCIITTQELIDLVTMSDSYFTKLSSMEIEYLGDFVFDKGNNILLCYLGNETELILPTLDNDYKLADYLFWYNSNITNITIPSSVTKIGMCVFLYSGLTSAKFEATTGWWVATSSTATSGTDVTGITAETSESNANLLIKTSYDGGYSNRYWFRTVA